MKQTQRKPPDLSDIGEPGCLTLSKLSQPLANMLMVVMVVLLRDYCKSPEMVLMTTKELLGYLWWCCLMHCCNTAVVNIVHVEFVYFQPSLHSYLILQYSGLGRWCGEGWGHFRRWPNTAKIWNFVVQPALSEIRLDRREICYCKIQGEITFISECCASSVQMNVNMKVKSRLPCRGFVPEGLCGRNFAFS